jgi:hypothetical protein
MRPLLLPLLGACLCSGCTMAALERSSLSQTESVAVLRSREVLEDFARTQQDPCALPAYASYYVGGVAVTDSASLGATTVWQHVVGANGFGSQNVNPALSRQLVQNWTVDPVIDPEKLEAMRWCFRYVLSGRESLGDDGVSLLARPDQVPGAPGRHFGVLDQLERLPPNWLFVGSLHDVPLNACYKAHVGNAWVWVTPDGVKGLADFTLILQDIARVNINSWTLFNPGLNPYPLQLEALDSRSYLDVAVEDASPGPGARITRIGSRSIQQRPADSDLPAAGLRVGDVIVSVNGVPVADAAGFRRAMPVYNPKDPNVTLGVVPNPGARQGNATVKVTRAPAAAVVVAVDPAGRLAPDTPYARIRADSQGSDPFLRSQISTLSSH